MSSLSRPKPEKRVPGIDLLRGLSIVAVVLHHINLRIHFHDSVIGKLLGRATDRVLFWSGYYGVCVFFVISGFLITTWSLKRWGSLRQIERQQFYVMRFARIAPCLAGLLVLLSILDRAGVPRFIINPQHTSLGHALLAALTFHINWLEAHTGYLPAAWDVLWSLSVEEVFYFVFPLLCTVAKRTGLIVGLLSCLLVLGPYARVHTQNELWADYGYLSCMDGIALGCLAAIVAAKIRLSERANLALRISGTLLCVLIVVMRGTTFLLQLPRVGLNVTVLEMGTALLLIALQQRFENADGREAITAARPFLWRCSGWLRWFGRNSYEVYLTHMLVVWPMVGLFLHLGLSINMAPFWFLATTGLAGVTGHLVARFYSEPLNQRLRAKLVARSAVAANVR